MCLLSAIDLRQKQVATLLGISPQNLRNQRLRLLARITGRQADSVADFNEWIEGMKA
jgi:DNA-binding CsgD family transcriptional regulator